MFVLVILRNYISSLDWNKLYLVCLLILKEFGWTQFVKHVMQKNKLVLIDFPELTELRLEKTNFYTCEIKLRRRSDAPNGAAHFAT